MSYTPMSDLGQQGLFDITRTLLQQPDLASLCEALSQLVKRSALADNAAIVLWQAQTQRASYYASREKDTPIKYEDETVLAHGPVRRILSRPDTLHCSYEEFCETWPQLVAGGLYPKFGHYCLMPLAAEGHIFGGCEFIRYDDRPRIGRFELADKSSLFLDEVGDMPLELQPKLLRVLQEQEFERLGSNKIIQTDVRLIAATNRDLKKMVADREFRSDLYYRLNVFPIHLPPLRERPEDIPLLAKAFTFKIARRLGRNIDSIPAETLRTLSNMEWPGNVRELENVIECAVLLTRGNVLQLSLPDIALPEPETPPAATVVAQEGEDEYQLIVRVLKETNGVVAGPKGAAQRLGLKRTTLLSRMKRLGIDKSALI
ncbi:hypothetical protein HLL01_000055 [Shigella boydii]|nr:hypothetical protein [Escherichia coli]EFP6889028.1 hypothetical protein [Shigella boydii]EFW0982237.1 hypothetical protein [Shigella boydii]EFW9204130.1 hypothetical protein [Shigella boydii]EHO2251469.1 sigma 54-interacting transcriptional regulator [Shigella boydii]